MPGLWYSTLVAALLVSVNASGSSHGGPEVTVPGVGLLLGRSSNIKTANDEQVEVSEFLGIPFAQNPPPRFAAPQALEPSWIVVNATAYGPACIQQSSTAGVFADNSSAYQSESCLVLNVFKPAQARSDSGLPVMVWIYGGNLAFGSSSVTYYNGSSFAANQDIIVVTINYRVNIFGFSMSPEVPLEQRNPGFLDQRLALEWIQLHIEAFGGDPNKVTVFGESAGGYSVEQLLVYPQDPLPYRAIIMQSRAFSGIAAGVSPWDLAVRALGCSNDTALACMRSKDALEISQKVANITFGPVPDNTTFTQRIAPLLDAGETAQVPVLIGTNADEGTVLAQVLPFPADVITDYAFTCTTGLLSRSLRNNFFPVWRYYYNASFPNTTPFPNAGAYHASEIPVVFGTYPLTGATDAQVLLSRYMQTAWADFAKNPEDGPAEDWPDFGCEDNVQVLGDSEVSTIDAAEIEGICALYNDLIIAAGY